MTDVKFINSFSFIFNARPGTPAAKLETVDEKIAKQRLFKFQEISTQIKRNYRKEYDEYHAKPRQKKRRAARNSARKKMKCPAGKEAHHKDMNPRNNKRSNLKCVPKKTNRKIQPKRKT